MATSGASEPLSPQRSHSEPLADDLAGPTGIPPDRSPAIRSQAGPPCRLPIGASFRNPSGSRTSGTHWIPYHQRTPEVSIRPGANCLVLIGSTLLGPPLLVDGPFGPRLRVRGPHVSTASRLPAPVVPASAVTLRPASPVCGSAGAQWACDSHHGGHRSGIRNADRPTCGRSSPARGPGRAGFPYGSRRQETWHSNRPSTCFLAVAIVGMEAAADRRDIIPRSTLCPVGRSTSGRVVERCGEVEDPPVSPWTLRGERRRRRTPRRHGSPPTKSP